MLECLSPFYLSEERQPRRFGIKEDQDIKLIHASVTFLKPLDSYIWKSLVIQGNKAHLVGIGEKR